MTMIMIDSTEVIVLVLILSICMFEGSHCYAYYPTIFNEIVKNTI